MGELFSDRPLMSGCTALFLVNAHLSEFKLSTQFTITTAKTSPRVIFAGVIFGPERWLQSAANSMTGEQRLPFPAARCWHTVLPDAPRPRSNLVEWRALSRVA